MMSNKRNALRFLREEGRLTIENPFWVLIPFEGMEGKNTPKGSGFGESAQTLLETSVNEAELLAPLRQRNKHWFPR